jgi:hypothetical protein
VLTYGKRWILEDNASKKRFINMGRLWAARNGLELDDRPLAKNGIKPGMSLNAIKL